MKNRLLFTILLSALFTNAQQAGVTDRILNQSSERGNIAVRSSHLKSNNEHIITGFEDCELVLENEYTSITGKHFLYQQTVKGIPVYGASLKVNMNHAGQVISSFHTLIQPSGYKTGNTIVKQNYWVVNNNELVAVIKETNANILSLKQADGTILFSKDQRMYLTDTMVKAMVFNPDPLTTAGVVYGQGGTYKNFNDSDYVLLNNQRLQKTFPATFNNDTFYLANKYCIIKEFESPSFVPSTSTTGEFNFTRKQYGFKEVMAMYHIYAIQLYIQGLGFNEVKYQLKVDPHASTADQSYFSYSEGDTTLRFGLGGVPDAEDADVIVHEYTHAISFSLNPDGVLSSDRRALEEGSCDAMACAYSKKLSTYRWKNIFSWDGNNEFWEGRNGASNKTYENRIGSFYSDSEIWSSTLNNLMESLGEDVVIRLLLASIPQWNSSTSMLQAAQIMYDTDSIINNKVNQGYLAVEFNARKLGDFPVGMNDITNDKNFLLRNTSAFSQGTGNAVLSLKNNNNMHVEVIDLNGSTIEKMSGSTITVESAKYDAGVYFINVISDKASGYYKLIRY